MWEFLTEILLGTFVVGWLLLYSHHATEIRDLKADLADAVGELADTTGRVVNLEAAAECWTTKEKRNGNTA